MSEASDKAALEADASVANIAKVDADIDAAAQVNYVAANPATTCPLCAAEAESGVAISHAKVSTCTRQ